MQQLFTVEICDGVLLLASFRSFSRWNIKCFNPVNRSIFVIVKFKLFWMQLLKMSPAGQDLFAQLTIERALFWLVCRPQKERTSLIYRKTSLKIVSISRSHVNEIVYCWFLQKCSNKVWILPQFAQYFPTALCVWWLKTRGFHCLFQIVLQKRSVSIETKVLSGRETEA